MAQTRFRSILDEYSRLALADPLHRQQQLRRLAWNKLTGIWGLLANSTVWNAQPVLLEGWRDTQFRCPVVDEIRALGGSVELVRHGGQSVCGTTLATWLWEALLWCAGLMRPEVEREISPKFTAREDWAHRVRFQRKHLIEELAGMTIPGLEALLLQGSLADGLVEEGYSDCDVIVVLAIPPTAADFCDQISAVMRLNSLLVAYQPLMHHGPQVYFKQSLGWATEATMPSAVLAKSVLLQGRAFSISYVNGDLEAGQMFDMFEQFFERNFLEAVQLQTAFDALWWSANLTILPLLEYQLRHQESVWKRDLLTQLREPAMDRMTEVRQRLGEWVAPRLAADNWPDRGFLNPGVGVSHHRHALTVAGHTVGLDDSAMTLSRQFLCSVTSRCFNLNYTQVFRVSSPTFGGWPSAVSGRPITASAAEYEELRGQWARWAQVNPQVAAVYEFGSVACPGLSDLDLLFVVTGNADPASFSIGKLPPRQRYLMGHDVQIVPIGAIESFSHVCPMFSLRHLAGTDVVLTQAAELPADTLAAALTAYNCRKYPGDLLLIADAEEADFRTILAFLHSFGHVANGLAMMGQPVPDAIQQCTALDATLRAEFAVHGSLLSGELAPAMRLMMGASAAMLHQLEQYWIKRLPWLTQIEPASTISSISENMEAARRSNDVRAIGFAPLLDVICCYLADPDAAPLVESDRLGELLMALSGYRAHKSAYKAAAHAAGLGVDVYLADPRYLEGPQPVSLRFYFEAACGRGPGGIARCNWDQAVLFHGGGDGLKMLAAGWSTPEDWGTWSAGAEALLLLQLPEPANCRISFHAQPFVCAGHPEQRVRLSANGKFLAECRFRFGEAFPPIEVLIPAEVFMAGGALLLRLELPDAISPSALELYADARMLAFGVQQLTFHLTEPA